VKETETLKIIALISTAYPNREWTEEQTDLWIAMLADVPLMVAQGNLREHILANRYPPSIADIARVDLEEKVDQEVYFRNKQIAHQEWVTAGGDPEAFIYDPRSSNPRLTG